MGQRNPEKDEERLLTSLGAAGVLGTNPDMFVPAIGGNDAAGNPRTWMDGTIGATIIGINIETDGAAAGIWGKVPIGYSTVTAIPVIANNDPEQTLEMEFHMKTYQFGQGGAIGYEVIVDTHIYTANDLNWVTELELSIAVVPGDIITFFINTYDSCTEIAVWGWWLVLT
jgi:hypothetical protein